MFTWISRIVCIFDVGALDGKRDYPRQEHGVAVPVFADPILAPEDSLAVTPFRPQGEARRG